MPHGRPVSLASGLRRYVRARHRTPAVLSQQQLGTAQLLRYGQTLSTGPLCGGAQSIGTAAATQQQFVGAHPQQQQQEGRQFTCPGSGHCRARLERNCRFHQRRTARAGRLPRRQGAQRHSGERPVAAPVLPRLLPPFAPNDGSAQTQPVAGGTLAGRRNGVAGGARVQQRGAG